MPDDRSETIGVVGLREVRVRRQIDPCARDQIRMQPDLNPLINAAPDATPLVPGRIHGIRAWSMLVDGATGEDLLGAIARDVVWPRGQAMRATCVPGGHRGTHSAPAPNCSCGIYAHHPFAAANLNCIDDEERVLGVIEGWGRVEVHELGFRAEYARPELLLVMIDSSSAHRNRVEGIGERYGVPCRVLQDREDFADFLEEEVFGLTEEVVDEFLAVDTELVLEPDCVAYLTERGRPMGGHGLAVKNAMEESPAPYKPEVELEVRGTRMIRVAGSSFHSDAIQGSSFDVGCELRLVPEPDNPHDPNAIAVWDAEAKVKAGYVPRALAPEIGEMLARDRVRTVRSAWEWRDLSDGKRFGLHVLVSRSERVRFNDPQFKALTAWDEIPF